jgi:hypothetical protein
MVSGPRTRLRLAGARCGESHIIPDVTDGIFWYLVIASEVDARLDCAAGAYSSFDCQGAFWRVSLAGPSTRSSRSRTPNRPSNGALSETGIHHRSGDDTLVALSAAAI